MSAQLYSVPGQTERMRRVYTYLINLSYTYLILIYKSIYLSYKLPLTCGGNVNYYKSVHHPIPTRGNREHPGNFQNKSVNSPFN